eukprot:1787220-Lingulodinium_polyedra.AAC.1
MLGDLPHRVFIRYVVSGPSTGASAAAIDVEMGDTAPSSKAPVVAAPESEVVGRTLREADVPSVD